MDDIPEADIKKGECLLKKYISKGKADKSRNGVIEHKVIESLNRDEEAVTVQLEKLDKNNLHKTLLFKRISKPFNASGGSSSSKRDQ